MDIICLRPTEYLLEQLCRPKQVELSLLITGFLQPEGNPFEQEEFLLAHLKINGRIRLCCPVYPNAHHDAQQHYHCCHCYNKYLCINHWLEPDTSSFHRLSIVVQKGPEGIIPPSNQFLMLLWDSFRVKYLLNENTKCVIILY